MKIWHISDTHRKHHQLNVPEVDMIIHSGDFSDTRKPDLNRNEVVDFINWFSSLPTKYKVLTAGNHDTSIFHKHFLVSEIPSNIIYLENSGVEIEGLKIYGAPQTPTFGRDWAWNVDRAKIHECWNLIPRDIDILVTHGPPMGILDATMHINIEQVGCRNLLKHITEIQPKLHCFGHIHNSPGFFNSGILKTPSFKTIFSNASCVEDRTMNIISNGNVLYV